MFSALLYLQYHSIKNRALLRCRRLKQPKYLVGGIVGAAYFYFYFFRYLLGLPGPRRRWAVDPSSDNLALYEALVAALLLAAVVRAWGLPHGLASLAFSHARVCF